MYQCIFHGPWFHYISSVSPEDSKASLELEATLITSALSDFTQGNQSFITSCERFYLVIDLSLQYTKNVGLFFICYIEDGRVSHLLDPELSRVFLGLNKLLFGLLLLCHSFSLQHPNLFWGCLLSSGPLTYLYKSISTSYWKVNLLRFPITQILQIIHTDTYSKALFEDFFCFVLLTAKETQELKFFKGLI